MTVTSSLILAFTVGLCVARFSPSEIGHPPARCRFRGDYCKSDLRVIIPLLPLYIFGIFLNMTLTGETGGILVNFIKVIGVIFVMHVVLLIIQFIIGRPSTAKSIQVPRHHAAGLLHSSRHLIVGRHHTSHLRQAKKMGVDPGVPEVTIPLCATIHLSGSTMKIVACALALTMVRRGSYDFRPTADSLPCSP